jgi:hypothetical protein
MTEAELTEFRENTLALLRAAQDVLDEANLPSVPAKYRITDLKRIALHAAIQNSRESARQRLLGEERLGDERKAATHEEIVRGSASFPSHKPGRPDRFDSICFSAGVRWAEAHHGIGRKK